MAARIFLLAMEKLGGASSLEAGQEDGRKWIETWIGKEGVYDYKMGRVFLQNCSHTAVFTPLFTHTNMLLQIISKEYGDSYKTRGKRQLKSVVDSLEEINNKKLKMANRVYFSHDSSLIPSQNPKDYGLIRYDPKIESKSVLKRHEKWVKKINKNLQSSLQLEDFSKEDGRIYSTIAYFKDKWRYKFITDPSCEDYFFLFNGKPEGRKYMKSEEKYGYEKIIIRNIEFDIVAVPFEDELREKTIRRGSDVRSKNFERYMVYLIPNCGDSDPVRIWDGFYEHAGNDLKFYLKKN